MVTKLGDPKLLAYCRRRRGEVNDSWHDAPLEELIKRLEHSPENPGKA